MNASWHEQSPPDAVPPPPDPTAHDPSPVRVPQTASHGTMPVTSVAAASAGGLSGLIGRFDLRDLIIAMVGFSIGFALVRAFHSVDLAPVGCVLALTTLPAVGRVIYVRRRVERAGESLTPRAAALAFLGTVIMMCVSIIPAVWIGILIGIVTMFILGIMALLFGAMLSASGDASLFVDIVGPLSLIIGAAAGVVALIALPRWFWRRWDRDLMQQQARHRAATPAGQDVIAEQVAPVAQPSPPKRRRYDGNPRRF